MELRQLKYFVVAAEECHITRAAKRLGIAQPPLSQQIQQLEEELGFTLFHRLPRGVALTEAGREFLAGARAVLERLDTAVGSASEIAQGRSGTLRVGFTSSAAHNDLVPNTISRFRAQYPNVATSLHEATTTVLLQQLRAGEIDAAFVRLAEGEGLDLQHDLVTREEMKVAVPKRHRLAASATVRVEDLAQEPFVMFPRASGRSLYEAVIGACRRAGFSPLVVQEAPQLASSISLVAAGVGIAFVPASMCHLHANHVAYLRISGVSPRADLHLALRSPPLPPPTVRFVALVKKGAGRRS